VAHFIAEAIARHDDRSASHLRLLLLFSCYLIPTFSETTYKLDMLSDVLDKPYQDKELTFTNIRRESQKLLPAITFLYRPPQALQTRIGDIGFMDDGEFVVLCNVRDQVDFQYAHQNSLTIECTGKYEVDCSDTSGRNV
jgi:hypothetical protein